LIKRPNPDRFSEMSRSISSGERQKPPGGLLGRFLQKLTRKQPGYAWWDIYSLPGNSGSPVFSSSSHRVIALLVGGIDEQGLYSGPHSQISGGVPIRKILSDLDHKWSKNELPEAIAPLVKEILESSSR